MKKEIKSGIYYIRCIRNNKIYIGSAINIRYRWVRHTRELNNNKHHSIRLQRAWKKYGVCNFEFGVFEYIKDIKTLTEIETNYINEYKSADNKFGFNILKYGNSMLGYKHSEKSKKLMSENNYMLGKKYDECKNGRARKVYQYTINGDFIREWDTLERAQDETGSIRTNIARCTKDSNATHRNFRWFNKYMGNKIDSISKKIFQIDFNGNIIEEFDLISDIVKKYTEFNISVIWSVCNGKRKRAYNYIWTYEKNYLK